MTALGIAASFTDLDDISDALAPAKFTRSQVNQAGEYIYLPKRDTLTVMPDRLGMCNWCNSEWIVSGWFYPEKVGVTLINTDPPPYSFSVCVQHEDPERTVRDVVIPLLKKTILAQVREASDCRLTLIELV